MLEHLERSNLFLVSLDAERRWFRYHHLFAETLRHSVQLARPRDIPGLHARAAS
jgi:LuxR family maltose regulon positive regulatory protein